MSKKRVPELKEQPHRFDVLINYLQHLKEIEKKHGIQCKGSIEEINTGITELPGAWERGYSYKVDLGGRVLMICIDVPNYRDILDVLREMETNP